MNRRHSESLDRGLDEVGPIGLSLCAILRSAPSDIGALRHDQPNRGMRVSMAQTDSNGHDSAAFTERMRAMLAESREHVEALAARRVALINEREGELARIKEDYKAKLDKIDGDLAAIRRIERAIDPEAHPKPPVPRANKRDSTHRTNAFTPSEDK